MADAGAWMPMYWADYFADTLHLTTEQHGAYMLLIGIYWRRGGPLPDDDRYLANVTKVGGHKWKYVRPILEGLFEIRDGVWIHKRVDIELLKSSERLQSARANGRAGGLAKSKLVTVTEPISKDIGRRSPAKSPEDAAEAKPDKSRKGARLPSDWVANEQHRKTARAKGLGYAECEMEAGKFKTYFTEGPGRNTTWANWDKAWANWCERAVEFAGRGAPVNGQRHNGSAPPRKLTPVNASTPKHELRYPDKPWYDDDNVPDYTEMRRQGLLPEQPAEADGGEF